MEGVMPLELLGAKNVNCFITLSFTDMFDMRS